MGRRAALALGGVRALHGNVFHGVKQDEEYLSQIGEWNRFLKLGIPVEVPSIPPGTFISKFPKLGIP